MLLTDIGDRRVVFVGGKGGVGKTSTAAALALARARGGSRVLLVSTDPAHNLGHIWRAEVGAAPVRLYTAGGEDRRGGTSAPTHPTWASGGGGGHVDGVELDPARLAAEHVAAVRATMEDLLPEDMHAQARAHLDQAKEAPGSLESAELEAIADLVLEGLDRYDLIVFDTAPTGHTVRLMALPEKLMMWTQTLLANRERSEKFASALRGMGKTDAKRESADSRLRATLTARQNRFTRLREVLLDPRITGFVVVFLAEALPLAETRALLSQLEQLGMPVVAAVANRRSPADAGEVLAARREMEGTYLARLAEAAPGLPIREVPLLPGEITGVEGLGRLAERLG